jgi:hypothetical protein
MPPPRASSAETTANPQSAAAIAAAIETFFAENQEAAVLEDGKVVFDLRSAKYSLSTEHERCSLHLWNEDRNMVRCVISASPRGDTLRLATTRLGHVQPKLVELAASRERRTPTVRESKRTRYMRVLERVLERRFSDWKTEGFRASMDLERSFGPAYARGMLRQGNAAWAVIGAGQHESGVTVDGILTPGILWLHHCREHADGKRLFAGLKVIVPRGSALLTRSRMAWLNADAAQWELYELDEAAEELVPCDLTDSGNLRTRLVHHPDETAARERFSGAVEAVMQLVPRGEESRVEQKLRSTAELVFLLHGLQFARGRISLAPSSFAHTLEITVGANANETPLTAATREELTALVAELFARRRVSSYRPDYVRRQRGPGRHIGPATSVAAHSRLRPRPDDVRLASRHGAGFVNPTQDPLYRAAPERWLESALRKDLAPLTRNLGPVPNCTHLQSVDAFANDVDPDTRGNRAESSDRSTSNSFYAARANPASLASRAIPRLDPRHVYSQVPAIAGADDHGLLDLLGVTADGRLAVIELKADDDLHFALQGLDYWIRVRHHHLQSADPATGLGEFQRHGYFNGVQLSPLPPRLYLVAPALRIHPATETVLRYFSPRVEWNLLALDERWREQIRVVWRRSGGRS